MSIENELSKENIQKYATACITLTENLVNKRGKYDTLLIPSRGAVPFFIGVTYALESLGRDYEEFDKLLRDIKVPRLMARLICERILPKAATSSTEEREDGLKVIFCPFTADINLEKYIEDEKLEISASIEEFTEKFIDDTRGYWTRFVNALRKDSVERKRDPFFQLYLYILREVEGRGTLAKHYENMPVIENIAMIDTVISGRASSTIIDSFEKLGIEPLPLSFLIIDENGRKLKPIYRRALEGKGDSVKMFEIPRIFTEDRGSTLEGLIGVVYPSLMYAAAERFNLGMSPVTAGSWHSALIENAHEKAFESFCKMLRAAINLESNSYCETEINEKQEEEALCSNKKEFLDITSKERLLEPTYHSVNFTTLKWPVRKSYETRSHVVHIPFSVQDSIKILSGFKHKFDLSKTR